jgi:hypothetical protein
MLTASQDEMYLLADVFVPGFKEQYFEFLDTGEWIQTKNYQPFPTDEFIESMSQFNLNS